MHTLQEQATRSPGQCRALPACLRQLLERSAQELSDEQQKQAEELLLEFTDVFSVDENDLGQTGLVKHKIQTGDAKPIRQPPRRLPFVLTEEANKEVERMQKEGTIEQSASP